MAPACRPARGLPRAEGHAGLGTVAASDDVTTGDAEQAGSASQDPGKAGANADAITSEASEEARVAGKAAPDAPDVRP